MMPFCEYRWCKRVAQGRSDFLRKWDSCDAKTSPNHTQEIWLCDKHNQKINKLLGWKL